MARNADGEISWAKIASKVGGWSDNQCWRRWQKLVPKSMVRRAVACVELIYSTGLRVQVPSRAQEEESTIQLCRAA